MASRVGIARAYAFIVIATILLLAVVPGFAQDSAVAPAVTRAAPQGLWITDYGFVSEYQGLQIRRSGTLIPHFAFRSAGLFEDPIGIVFSSSGDLWFIFYGTPAVFELTRSQLSALASGSRVKAKVALSTQGSGPGFSLPYALTFDSSGDLWVSDPGFGQISEFTPDQLKMSGTPAPATIITFNPTWAPVRLRFDKAGDLWLVGTTVVSELKPDQLVAGGTLTPSLTFEITGTIGTWVANDLVFDSAGNMWIAEEDLLGHSGVLDRVNAADLNATGDMTLDPEIIISPASISSTDFSIQCPEGLAFDDRGDLWLANGCSPPWGDIVEFTPDEIGASGSPLPKVLLRSNKHGTNLIGPTSILFGPLVP
jgi:hypothetical protein